MPVAADVRTVVRFVWTHPANEGQRVRAVLRASSFQVRGRVLGKRTRARLGERSTVWAELHRYGASKVVYANPPDHPEMLVWRRHLRPGDFFVDVGANIGSYSIWAAEMGVEVVAVEPASDTFELLEENIELNGYSVRAVRAAAGASCGIARMTSGQDVGNRMTSTGGIEVDMITIDSIVGERTIAGIKVDVEGYEIEVLRGCERALSDQRVRLLQLEWNSTSQEALGTDRTPIAELLDKYGYHLYRPHSDGGLRPIENLGFGPDVFALPDGRCIG